jgi:hypothetical protein
MTMGEIEGIPPGKAFATRRELYESGVHRALQAVSSAVRRLALNQLYFPEAM